MGVDGSSVINLETELNCKVSVAECGRAVNVQSVGKNMLGLFLD